jgi:hypothetical protein
MPYFRHDSLQFYFEEHGSGRPLVFSHGLGGNLDRSLELTRQLPNIHLVHMRLEKSLKVAKTQKVSLRLNVYNLTNINAEQSITQLSGVNFGRPAGVVPHRILELGVNYTF